MIKDIGRGKVAEETMMLIGPANIGFYFRQNERINPADDMKDHESWKKGSVGFAG